MHDAPMLRVSVRVLDSSSLQLAGLTLLDLVLEINPLHQKQTHQYRCCH